MSAKTNNGRESANQSPTITKELKPDHGKAAEIEASLMADLTLAVRYIRIAHDHYEIFDHQGFVFSIEKFLDNARNVSGKLKELRKVRGVTD